MHLQVQTLLDDHVIKTQTMKGSPYAAEFKVGTTALDNSAFISGLMSWKMTCLDDLFGFFYLSYSRICWEYVVWVDSWLLHRFTHSSVGCSSVPLEFGTVFLPLSLASLVLKRQERLEDWEKYLTAVQDVVDVWLKALSSSCFVFSLWGRFAICLVFCKHGISDIIDIHQESPIPHGTIDICIRTALDNRLPSFETLTVLPMILISLHYF